ncbi:MAG TPA: glycosyltransferase [Saprospiraceae bacterium]|nr:glycosyltransferase [Saprospiraceae bacterium]
MIITSIPDNFGDLGIVLKDPSLATGRHFPDYLIIGPWRTGTTWLSEMMRLHPDTFITDPKETYYFSHLKSPSKFHINDELMWYLDLFEPQISHSGTRQLLGEGSATYATGLSVEVIRFIYAVNPAIKIIFGVRHPVDRAWSHMKMNMRNEPEKFAGLSEAQKIKKAYSRRHILEAGMYSRHLATWRAVIPEEQLYIFNFDKLEKDPASLFSEVCQFLGVSVSAALLQSVESYGRMNTTSDQKIPRRITARLTKQYRNEINTLGQQYHIHFNGTNIRTKPRRPIVLRGSRNLSYSETFIESHIEYLHASTLHLQDYLPLAASGHSFPILTALNRLRGYINMRRLHHALKKTGGNILIEYGTTAAKALPALRSLKRKIVVHFHGHDAHRAPVVKTYEKAYRELFAEVDALVAVSATMKQALIDMGANPDQVHHIVCGVNTENFQATNVAENPPVFFACGRFVEKKAPQLTIRAFHKAHLQNDAIRLRMAGDGPLWEPCRQLISELNLQSCVELLGVIHHHAVAQELCTCRSFLQHSVTASDGDAEGTPVGVLEAGCCGVPVIATRHAGIADVVVDGETGILVAEFDVDAMSKAILHLAEHPEEARRMGSNARSRVCERYSIQKSIAQLQKLLEY